MGLSMLKQIKHMLNLTEHTVPEGERGIPTIIESGNSSHFTGELIQLIYKWFGIKQKYHVPYQPQASGNMEQCNQMNK